MKKINKESNGVMVVKASIGLVGSFGTGFLVGRMTGFLTRDVPKLYRITSTVASVGISETVNLKATAPGLNYLIDQMIDIHNLVADLVNE